MSDKTAVSVERIHGISADQFFTDYVKPHKPVVLTDAMESWPALSLWTPAFFRSRYQKYPISIEGKQYLLGEYMDSLENAADLSAVPYLRNKDIHKFFPDLAHDIEPAPAYFKPNWLEDQYFPKTLSEYMHNLAIKELFIGGTGTLFPILHYDFGYSHAFLSQVYGKKQFVMYSPDQHRLLYLDHNGQSPVKVLEEPDLNRFPLFAKASPTSVILEPGETLFIPGGWAHYTRGLSVNITVSLNTVNNTNWTNFVRTLMPHVGRIRRPFVYTYLSMLGFFKMRMSH